MIAAWLSVTVVLYAATVACYIGIIVDDRSRSARWLVAFLVMIVLTVIVSCSAARADAPPCPLSATGLLWTAKGDYYTMFIANPTRQTIAVDRLDLTVQIAPDTGGVPDPKNERTVIIIIPTTQVAPMAVTPIDFKASNINPQSTTGGFKPECGAV